MFFYDANTGKISLTYSDNTILNDQEVIAINSIDQANHLKKSLKNFNIFGKG